MSSKLTTEGNFKFSGQVARSLGPRGVTSHRLRAGTDLQLLVDSSDVCVHGRKTHAQFLRNFLVEEALGEKFQNFAFPRRKILTLGRSARSRRLRSVVLKGLNDFARDIGAHRRTAGVHFL